MSLLEGWPRSDQSNQNVCEIRVAYRVAGNTDDIEGKGTEVILGYFWEECWAEDAAKGRGPMGTDASVTAVRVIITPLGVFQLAHTEPLSLADKAVQERAEITLEELKQKLNPAELAELARQIRNR